MLLLKVGPPDINNPLKLAIGMVTAPCWWSIIMERLNLNPIEPLDPFIANARLRRIKWCPVSQPAKARSETFYWTNDLENDQIVSNKSPAWKTRRGELLRLQKNLRVTLSESREQGKWTLKSLLETIRKIIDWLSGNIKDYYNLLGVIWCYMCVFA